MGQDLIIYAWDVTERRYLYASEFKITVDYQEGESHSKLIAFYDLEPRARATDPAEIAGVAKADIAEVKGVA